MGQEAQSTQASQEHMQHQTVKVILKVVLNMAKSRQSIQDKNLSEDYVFAGTTEAPSVPPWEQGRSGHVWVPRARRHTLPLLLAQVHLQSLSHSQFTSVC